MCVVAIAWRAHPDWLLVAAGNRDEYHARASAPLAAWNDGSGIVAGRDLVSGGTWMGISEAGRFAVVTNIRNAAGPDASLLSRGSLVADWLGRAMSPNAPERFNPFNLIVAGRDGIQYIANRPAPQRATLASGIHGLSNAIANEHWPRKERLEHDLAAWLEAGSGDPAALFDGLRDEAVPDRDAHPLFINSPVYGTRCSTVVLVDAQGRGRIIERRFDASGTESGESEIGFSWDAAASASAANRWNQ
jgi:uncharacterized protein with NRDE domain